MKYFSIIFTIILASCNNTSRLPARPPSTNDLKPRTKTHSPPKKVPPSAHTFNDKITVLSMVNSLSQANINDSLTIDVRIQNSGDDFCKMCNVSLSYAWKPFDNLSAGGEGISDGLAIRDLAPGQVGIVKTKFDRKLWPGYFTFYLTDLYGLFQNTNGVKHFYIPANVKTYLTVSQ